MAYRSKPSHVRQIAARLTLYLEQLLLAEQVDEISRFYAAMQPGGEWAICRVASTNAAIWEAAEIIARVHIRFQPKAIKLPVDSILR